MGSGVFFSVVLIGLRTSGCWTRMITEARRPVYHSATLIARRRSPEIMQRVDTLIEAKWVIPVEPEGCVLADHSVAVTDGRIGTITAETATYGETIGCPPDLPASKRSG